MWIFPYPRCWARALLTLVSMTIGGFVVNFVGGFLMVLVAIVVALTGDFGLILVVPIRIGQGVVIFWFHTLVRQWVAMRKESISWSWIPPKRFWYESFIDWMIFFSSVVFVYVFYTAPTMLSWESAVTIADFIQVGVIVFILTAVLMAYIHQVRYLVLMFWEKNQRKKMKAKERSSLPRVKRPARIVQDDEPRQR